MPSKKIAATMLAPILMLGSTRASANEFYKDGIRQGISARLADTLAMCRQEAGDGDDWLGFYLLNLNVREKTKEALLTLPMKLRTEKAQEMLAGSGSTCKELLGQEEKFGIGWFKKNVIEEYIDGFCARNPKC